MTEKPMVLMATYNGEHYLPEQLASIESQSVPVDIVARDDNSTDGTLRLLEAAGLAKVLQRGADATRFGHLANFSALCDYAKEHTDNSYYLFADQDDSWHSGKVERVTQRIRELEAQYGADTPILVHSDLRVVNENLEPIADSFWRFQGLPNPAEHSLPRFLYQNVVTGCACGFNRALLNIATSIPQQALVHDFWFALVAQLTGIVDFIDEPLIDYRQHGANSIGAVSFEEQVSWSQRYIYKSIMRFPRTFMSTIEQAEALLVRLEGDGRLSKHDQALLKRFIGLPRASFFQRLKQLPYWFDGKRSFREKQYLRMVMVALPYLSKPQK